MGYFEQLIQTMKRQDCSLADAIGRDLYLQGNIDLDDDHQIMDYLEDRLHRDMDQVAFLFHIYIGVDDDLVITDLPESRSTG